MDLVMIMILEVVAMGDARYNKKNLHFHAGFFTCPYGSLANIPLAMIRRDGWVG
jgi:hypothetical protein